ncbi:UDP-galactopyranose mutase [Oscillospiraceae bacterium CM]|nr:UDP-galactopyranose mutase [Oscillospiraceae bacterium CM]
MRQYDFLIVGAGLFGAVCARELTDNGKRCLVIEKRSETGGNVACRTLEDITVHQYGAHIFHTKIDTVWAYVNRFVRFNHFINCPMANYKGDMYNLPFNMNTFYGLWRVRTPEQAKEIIAHQRAALGGKAPENLEEQAISLVGTDIFRKLIKGYTEKQWGRDCRDLPAFIIRRLPVRYTYDNNYFSDPYQGVPIGGYNALIDKLLEGVEVIVNCDYLAARARYNDLADTVIYTGQIDAYFNYALGVLAWRSLRFETETLAADNFQGSAVVNYTDRETPYTRIIEHKHFEFGAQEKTVVTREYPMRWEIGQEPYYPVNDDCNGALYSKYKTLAERETRVIFGGRLGTYQYMDMDQVIDAALKTTERVLKDEKSIAYR